MLLPRPELDDEGEPIDPRLELVNQLVEYQRFKEISSELELKSHNQSFLHTRSMEQATEGLDDVGRYLKNVTLFDLSQYFKEAMDRMPVITAYELKREPISLDSKKQFIFKEGKLATAIRSSMAYPFYLTPVSHEDKLLFDGGLYNNFPSDIMYADFSPDFIIGSNVSSNFEIPDEDNLVSQIKN